MGKEKQKKLILSVIALILGLLYLMPVIWLVLSSLKTDTEIFRMPPTFFPENPTLQGYLDQVDSNILGHAGNSLLIAGGSMCIALVLSIPAAYGLARFQNKLRKPIILLFLISQLLPAALLLTPLFIAYNQFGLLNTYWAPVLSTVTTSIPFVIILMRPYFAGLPKSIEEAARVDGCTVCGAFVRIMLPVAQNGLLTCAIFCFIFPWNDLAYSMSFIQDASKWPLTVIINDFQTKYGIQWNSILAYGVCLILPVLVAFVFLQKYIVAGLTSGAVKE